MALRKPIFISEQGYSQELDGYADSVQLSAVQIIDADGNQKVMLDGYGNFAATGEATLASATVSDLTQGRVVLAGAGGAIVDDAALTFASNTLTLGAYGSGVALSVRNTYDTEIFGIDGYFGNGTLAGSLDVAGNLQVDGEATLASATVSDLTQGRLVFAGASGALVDDSKLTFDGYSGALNVDGEATFDSAIVSDLTDTRIVFAGANGALVDDSRLTFDGYSGALNVDGEATFDSAVISDLTDTRVVFAGASGALVDSADFTYAAGQLSLGGSVTGSVSVKDDMGITRVAVNSVDGKVQTFNAAGHRVGELSGSQLYLGRQYGDEGENVTQPSFISALQSDQQWETSVINGFEYSGYDSKLRVYNTDNSQGLVYLANNKIFGIGELPYEDQKFQFTVSSNLNDGEEEYVSAKLGDQTHNVHGELELSNVAYNQAIKLDGKSASVVVKNEAGNKRLTMDGANGIIKTENGSFQTFLSTSSANKVADLSATGLKLFSADPEAPFVEINEQGWATFNNGSNYSANISSTEINLVNNDYAYLVQMVSDGSGWGAIRGRNGSQVVRFELETGGTFGLNDESGANSIVLNGTTGNADINGKLDVGALALNVDGYAFIQNLQMPAVGDGYDAVNRAYVDGYVSDLLLQINAASDSSFSDFTAAESLALGNPVFINTSSKAAKADADFESKSWVIGVAKAAASAEAAVEIIRDGVCAGALTGLSFAAADQIWLAPGGGLVNAKPTASGARLILVGFAKSADDLFVDIRDYGRNV